MSMPTPSLKEFMVPVPVCKQTTGLEAVLEIFNDGLCDRLVVVDEKQSPLGVVSLRSLVPHFMGKMSKNPIDASSFILEHFIEPIATLPAHFTPSQFWPHLQAMQTTSGFDRHWGLVDSSGFVGLLDSWQLLKYLASSTEKATLTKTDNTLPACSMRRDACSTGTTEKAASEKRLFITALKPLMQLLEVIPLPLRLQTAAGKVISQNLNWRQQIGEELLEQKMPDGSSWKEPLGKLSRSFYPALREPLPYTRSSARGSMHYEATALFLNGPQRYTKPLAVRVGEPGSGGVGESVESHSLHRSCPPTPLPCRTPALVHDSSLSPVTRASSPSLKPLTVESSASGNAQTYSLASGKLKNGQERVFSLLKISLTNLGLSVSDFGSGSELGEDGIFPQPRLDSDENLESDETSEQLNVPNSSNGSTSISTETLEILAARSATSAIQSSNLMLVLAQDVTEQQQVAKELVAKNADLIQLNRFKDEFLACISHELKTPLTAVLGLSGLLKDQLVGKLNERQAHYAQLIHQSGRTLMAVVNDILDLTRMETGCLELTPEPVNIKSICDRAYLQAQQQKSLKGPAGESQGETPFTLHIEDGLQTIVADELRLRQMLVHLLSNALKFTDTSGEIGLKVNHWDGWIAFTVWDTGIGIPDTQQHLIFQKFQQLENPLTRQFEGTGLGLVLTQRLARLHGGDVSFISKAGQGSQFTLLLPPSPPQGSFELGILGDDELKEIPNFSSSSTQSSARAGLPRPYKTQNFPSRLVLIVEAAPQYITDLTEQLIGLGYRVVIARSGTEAIEKARRLQPQVVLLNPLLPQLSGWDVLTLLKSDDQTRHIPIVVTATQVERELALSNKADDFLSLPVQEEALRQSLDHLITHIPNTCTNLTILCLSPSQVIAKRLEVAAAETDSLLSVYPGLNCRVLEADDLDQAELLARFWHPDVVLLDGANIKEPLAYLKEFSLHTSLVSLPLVTLDHHTTQAANQMPSLSVFPCLASSSKDKTAAIWQVIQVAAGISCNPSILVVNLATLPDLSVPFVMQGLPLDLELEAVDLNQNRELENSQSPTPRRRKGPKSQNRKTRELASLQALIQYLQTAGFRSLLSRSWAEVCQQIHHQNANLVLIHLSDALPNEVLSTALTSLANIPALPPILVLDHRPHGETADENTSDEENSTTALESVLKTVATPIQILQEPSQSMAELLDKINQMLGV